MTLPRFPSKSRVSLPTCLLVAAGIAAQCGCTSTFLVGGSSEPEKGLASLEAEEEEEDDSGLSTEFVRSVAVPWGMNPMKLEGVALVTGLNKTGSDPPPTPLRDNLIGEMQTYDVKNPNMVLASADTSLVLLRAFLPPGVKKGDRFDVEVRVPTGSETKSLRGGWLMRSRLRQTAIVESALHTGDVEALAEGSVVIDALFDSSSDEVREVQGRVLGGGVSVLTRPLGLAVQSENHSVKAASLVGAAINARFHTYDRGVKRGVAEPKRDNFVQLDVHPRYRHNLVRYVRVIQNIALSELPADRMVRVELLERKLLEPATSSGAALQLEAIGAEAVPVLAKGLRAENSEVRFYAAEALAYLDDTAATEFLVAAARDEPAFRWHAIAALSAMDNVTAYEGLAELLHVSSAETRYAAFRAMRVRNPLDPLVSGERLIDEFTYHAIDSPGPAMVHFSRSRVAEMVVFGQDVRLQQPSFLYAGDDILLKAVDQDRIKVMRFTANKEDQHEVCSTELEDVVRTIVRLGGDYGDVIQCLQEARQRSFVDARVVVDALPRQGRSYRRSPEQGLAADADAVAAPTADSPLAEMFQNSLSGDEDVDNNEGLIDIDPPQDLEDKGFFGKLKELL